MKNPPFYWPFLAFISLCHCCTIIENGYYSNETGNCLPCQEEKVAYFGNNIKDYSPGQQKMSLAQCQIECFNVNECNFWSYEVSTSKCYLKSQRKEPTKGVDFISGIKNCTKKSSNLEKNGQIYVVLKNQDQKLSVLPADFGQQIHSNTEFHGTLATDDEFNVNSGNLSKFCQMEQVLPVGKKSRQIAFSQRGQCEFAIKAINAQAAGYKALIILDLKNDKETFSRIVSSSANSIPASFIRIPVVLLLKNQAKIAMKSLQEPSVNQKILIKRFASEENDHQMATNTTSSIPSVFQKGGILHWIPYTEIETFISKWSPISLILMGGAILVGSIIIVAFQVCICSKCFKKRRRSRVLPESCTEIPYMTAQLPNAVPYDVSITGAVNSLDQSASQRCSQYNETVEVSCPVCFEVPLPPRKIYQCSQGHALCDLCLSKIDKKCPTCREDWANSSNLPVRNRMAESMLHNYFVNPSKPDTSGIPDPDNISFHNETMGNNIVTTDPYAPSAPPGSPPYQHPSSSFHVSKY